MNRRSFLFALLGAPTVASLVAACGNDGVDPGADRPYVLATGANDVVLSVAEEGGFVAPETHFARLPNLLVTGDGRVFTPGAVPEIYPGPLVMPMMVGTITTGGLQRLIEAADEARLVGFVADYALPDGVGIADAPDTVVTVTVNGTTYTHVANALGFDGTTTPARQRLSTFVGSTGDLATLVGAENVGASTAFAPESYRIRATITDPDEWSDPKPTVVAWPETAGVTLAAATVAGCAVVAAELVGDLFTSANQTTLFQEGDLVYQVTVVMQLPGDTGCPTA